MKVFVTDRANKGLEIVAGKYQFIDGMMAVTAEDAELLAPILCRFYGCTLEDVSADAYNQAKDRMDPAFLESQKKAAEAVGADAPVKAMVESIKTSGDPNHTGTLTNVPYVEGDAEEQAQESTAGAVNKDADPKVVHDQKVVNKA